MRVLLLCAVTFVAGVLFGSLVLTGDEAPPPRPTVRRTVESERAASRPAQIVAGGTAVESIAREASVELDRAAAESAAALGTGVGGSITGTVRNAAGQPVAGVRVTAAPNGIPAEVGNLIRQDRIVPHRDRELEGLTRKTILRELWRRRSRNLATSGPDGRYELSGLTGTGYRLSAHHDRYEVKSVSPSRACAPGSRVDFVARPVIETKVEVRLPDGSLVNHAWIQWTGPNGSGSTAWTPEAATARLPLGSCTISTQAQLAGRSWDSERIQHVVTPDAPPVVLEVRPRPQLSLRIHLQDDLSVPTDLQFRLCPVQSGTKPDSKSLVGSNYVRLGRKTANDRAIWRDLEPGSYVVGVTLDPELILAWMVVDFQAEQQEFDLSIPDLAARPHLFVRVFNPAGGLVREGARFSLVTKKDGRNRYLPHECVQTTDGGWLLVLRGKSLEPKNASLTVTAKPFGSVSQELQLGRDPSAVVRFQEPARLRAKVAGYAGSGLEGHLNLRIEDRERQVGYLHFRADGASHSAARIQPGRYEILLIFRDDSGGLPVWRRSLTLESGDRDLAIALPALHEVRIRTTGSGTVEMRSSDLMPDSMSRQGRPDADGVILFRNVATGSYVLVKGDRRTEIRVPYAGVLAVE